MSLIDSSYFKGDIAIPNLDKRINTIQSAIDQYEKEILICLLGQELYDTFMDALDAPPVDQKWIDLRDGASFTLLYNGRNVNLKWGGLINPEKISFIAYYVYYQIRFQELSTTTSIGEVKGKSENSHIVNETRKMVTAWRKFLELYGDVVYSQDGINYNGFSYTSPYSRHGDISFFDKYSEAYDTYNDLPTAYNFINTNKDDYPKWILTPKGNVNEFGI